ncbi:hypothetical protein [Oceanobacillus senegalensis]|uniref:hypothetical protein n=1 Tax=Oceanobacillus senegalensis TaxID=1936063 RepID=UPI000A30D638|nr:hypothetical protein [Oceanobacillus senegalensis]
MVLFYGGIVVIILGCITSYINAESIHHVGPYGEETIFEWRFFFSSITQYIFHGFILIGFSELLKLLEGLNHRKIQVNIPESTNDEISSTSVPFSNSVGDIPIHESWTVDLKDQEKVNELFSDQAILEISASGCKGYCIVKVQDFDGPLQPELKVVDVRGDVAEEIRNTEVVNKLLASFRNP